MDAEPRGSGDPPTSGSGRGLVLSLAVWPVAGLLILRCGSPGMAAALAMALLVPSWRAIRRDGYAPRDAPGVGRWGVGIAMLVALVMRTYGLDDYPVAINHDEGAFAIIARDLVGRPWCPFSPLLNVGSETGMYYLIQFSLGLFGVRPWALHLPGVLASLAGLAAMHALAARVFGPRVAFAALAFAAVAPLPNVLARLSHQSNLVPLVSCLGYWALFSALERGGRWRYILAGVALGLGWHTFHGYRANALAGPALALVARWRLRGDEAPRAFATGFAWMLLGYMIPFSVVLHQLASDPGLWLAPLMQHTFAGSGATPSSVALVVWTALVDAPTGGAPALVPASFLVLGALPLACATRDRRGLLLAWLLVTHLAPLAGTASDATARHRYATVLPALAIFAACTWTSLERTLRGRWRVAWRAGGLAFLLHMAYTSAHQLIQYPGEGDAIRREMAVLRAASERVRDGTAIAYFPSEYHGHAHFALRFFFLDPRIRELPGDDVRAIDPAADALIVPGGAELVADVLDAYPGARAVSLALPYPVPSSIEPAWLVPRSVQAEARAPFARDGWLHVPRDGRYALTAPPAARGELWIDGGLALRAEGGNARVDVALGRGIVAYGIRGEWPQPPRWVLVVPDLVPPSVWSLPEPPWPLPALADCAWTSPGLPSARGGVAVPMPFSLTHRGSRLAALSSPMLHDVACGGGGRRFIALGDRVVATSNAGVIDPGFVLDEGVLPPARASTALTVLSRAWSLAPLPDGRLAVTAWQRRWVGIVDSRSGAVRATLERAGGWGEPLEVAVAEDGRVAVADRLHDRVVEYSPALELRREIPIEHPTSVCWVGSDLVVLAGVRHALVRVVDGRVTAARYVGAIGPGARIEHVSGTVALASGPALRFYDAALRLLEHGGSPVVYPPAGPWSAGNLCGIAWDATEGAIWLVSDAGQLVHYTVR